MPNIVTTADGLADGSGSWPLCVWPSVLAGHYKRTAAYVADSSTKADSPKIFL